MKGNVTALVTTNHLPEKTLVSISLSDFLTMKIAPQEAILEPWLNSKSLNMLHAKRGVGKTYVGLSIAYAVATGTNYLKWKAPKARKVVYLDGEMSSYTLQSRLKAISDATPSDQILFQNLKILTPDLQNGPIPDLADRQWHESVRSFIADAELVIVDNLSCLARSGGPENDADSWNVLSDWALQLRREGVAVLFMHHSGKSGQQRGTSRKEDILNIVMNLKHPAEYSPEMGALFEVHFEKGREMFGENCKSFIAKLVSDENFHKWEVTDIEESNFDRVVAMSKLDLTLGEIAAELDLSKSSVSRHQKRAREEGLIKKTQ
jgi:hypothetical protein